MKVSCYLDECIHYNSGECRQSEIEIDCDGCISHSPFYESAEYQKEYWKCVRTNLKGQPGRVAAKGKPICINGLKFFTGCDDRLPESEIIVTEEKTGYLAGNIEFLKNNWDKAMEEIKKHPDVKQYPICRRRNRKGVYLIEEESRC